ncbi:MAG TPA: carboxypeptidase-like regulatory domain-containing protein, partial [Cyclobacteriaceae bacterium]|nr:carboxypeptidase-like regulatory domain-containing protein [Cyclobacteriaceae bacterium]
MKKYLLLGCCLFLTATLYGQQRAVTGKVTDGSDGSSLPGVSVLVKGTTRGTATDATGGYSIEAASGDVLIFSFIGFETQEVEVG